MRNIKWLAGVGIALIVTVVFFIAQPKIAAREYIGSIETHRAEINEFMAYSSDSPMPADTITTFTGLNYYPIDDAFRADATVVPFVEQELIEVPTSAGTLDPYYRYGTISFEINGTALAFEAWKPVEGKVSNRLFVAFTDLTSGDETYGGGRYLSIYLDRDGSALIDFNLAYNPYCVYDVSYICPVAPNENRLPVAITAGEQNWK